MGLCEVARKSCLIEETLKIIVMVYHSLLEGRRIIGGKKICFPIEKKVLVLMKEDKIDISFDIIWGIRIAEFDFGIKKFDLSKSKGVGEKGCMKDMFDKVDHGFIWKVRRKFLFKKIGDIEIRVSENCFKKRMKKNSSVSSFGKFCSEFWV